MVTLWGMVLTLGWRFQRRRKAGQPTKFEDQEEDSTQT